MPPSSFPAGPWIITTTCMEAITDRAWNRRTKQFPRAVTVLFPRAVTVLFSHASTVLFPRAVTVLFPRAVTVLFSHASTVLPGFAVTRSPKTTAQSPALIAASNSAIVRHSTRFMYLLPLSSTSPPLPRVYRLSFAASRRQDLHSHQNRNTQPPAHEMPYRPQAQSHRLGNRAASVEPLLFRGRRD